MADRLPEPISPGAVPHDPACPVCGHSHLWLDCDLCPCVAHIQPGIYPEEA